MQLLGKLSTGLVVAGCMAALPATAHADVVLMYSINGSAATVLCTSAGVTCSGSVTVGGVTILNSSIGSNAPGTSLLSNAQTSTLSITNAGTSAANITIWAEASGFTNPVNGLLENKLGGSSTAGTTGSASLTSCENPGPLQATVSCSGAANVTSAAGVTLDGTSFNKSTNAAVAALGTPYYLANVLTVTSLSAGGSVNFGNTTDVSAVPEPASMTLLATGLFGLVGFVRRRKESI